MVRQAQYQFSLKQAAESSHRPASFFVRRSAQDYRNTLHVINGLVKNQQYPELERYVEELRIADEVHNGRIARLIKDQVLAAFLQSKVARAAELGIELDVEPDSHADEIPDAPFRQPCSPSSGTSSTTPWMP